MRGNIALHTIITKILVNIVDSQEQSGSIKVFIIPVFKDCCSIKATK